MVLSQPPVQSQKWHYQQQKYQCQADYSVNGKPEMTLVCELNVCDNDYKSHQSSNYANNLDYNVYYSKVVVRQESSYWQEESKCDPHHCCMGVDEWDEWHFTINGCF